MQNLENNIQLGADGQPLNFYFNKKRREGRNLDELVGLVKGILADGLVCKAECEVLANWCTANGDETGTWPIGPIVGLLAHIYEDGIVTPQELDNLRFLLTDLVGEVGEARTPPAQVGCIPSTALPLSRPAPKVVFYQKVFVFTGKFASGTRNDCFKQTMLRGGICENTITRRVDYLVIGSMGSRDWIHSPWGRKIELAMELQKSKPISIISEETFCQALL
jgi:hypothetical protein